MTLLDIVGGALIGTAALVMTVVTVGPFYLLFEAGPAAAKNARKERFIELRRLKRKERMRAKREHKTINEREKPDDQR